MSVLDKLVSYEAIKQLNNEELETLCGEIREFLISKVALTGGHLASNLGVVELSVALHRVFDFKKDKIIFDVGHQSYVHKILTGRKDGFSQLRKSGGISGFPKTSESEYDFFDTGHSSDSLSVAAGFKRAARIKGEKTNVLALIGDGSFGGGMVYEAMNDIGHTKKDNIIVILNDNGMSISKNSSSISKHLRKLRLSSSYISTKKKVERKLHPLPGISKLLRKLKATARKLLIGETVFENLGFEYYGPYDGHNLTELINIFENAKQIDKPVVIHIKTKKGKGYPYAEENPEIFHGISSFDVTTGTKGKSSEDYSAHFGKTLVTLAKNDKNIVAVTAAMPSGTGLSEFAEKYPDRFFDVGICEEHAAALCGGMSAGGLKPVLAVYSTFLQRSFDQLICDVALMKLHTVICIDRAGLVGADGETHQGIFDISYIRSIPGITLMSPSSFSELDMMLEFALNQMNTPVAIRYPRGNKQAEISHEKIEFAKSEIVSEGTDITIISEGQMLSEALCLKELLSKDNINAEIINVRFINPLDLETIRNSVVKTKKAVVLECGIKSGGMGEAIASELKDLKADISLKNIPDSFIEHGEVSELMKKLRLDADSLYEDIKKEFFS